jgi:predicted metal-dependent hydrolase
MDRAAGRRGVSVTNAREHDAGARQLPAYTVRVSRRAHYVRLTVTPRDGLVVVVPERWRGDPARVVAAKREWAERALAKIADKHALHAAGPEALLPDRVDLAALGESWPVEYRAGSPARTTARVQGATVVVSGDVDDAQACLCALRRWLDREARAFLIPLLDAVASQVRLAYAGARVRHTRSRWGSCSHRKTISLSRNLVFLPPHLVRALMLHELAHTRVMNHSPRFWTELERYDEHAQRHRAEMRSAEQFVPPWAES